MGQFFLPLLLDTNQSLFALNCGGGVVMDDDDDDAEQL